MSDEVFPSPDDIMRHALQTLKTGEKQKQAFAAISHALPERIKVQEEYCKEIDLLIDIEAEIGADRRRGAVEQAVNEYGILGSLYDSTGDHLAGERAYSRGLAASAFGDTALIARATIDKAFQDEQAGRPASALSSLFWARDRLLADLTIACRADRSCLESPSCNRKESSGGWVILSVVGKYLSRCEFALHLRPATSRCPSPLSAPSISKTKRWCLPSIAPTNCPRVHVPHCLTRPTRLSTRYFAF